MTVLLPKPAVILTDIEGTTTSIRFWNDVLAPFILQSVADCLTEWWDREYCSDVVQIIRHRTEKDWFEGDHTIPVIAGELEPKEKIIASLVINAHFLMANKHNEAVKSLTLLVWLYGYEKGLLKGKQTLRKPFLTDYIFQGHVFKDVATSFQTWQQEKITICTFASGSSLSQELLFCKTVHGNMQQLVTAFFDTHWLGRKSDPASYRKLAREVNKHRSSILFISDSIDGKFCNLGKANKILLNFCTELEAASKVGFTSVLIIRSHNKILLKNKFHGIKNIIKEFTDLKFN